MDYCLVKLSVDQVKELIDILDRLIDSEELYVFEKDTDYKDYLNKIKTNLIYTPISK